MRLLFRYYILYISIIMLDIDDNTLKKLNIFIWILLLLELPVVAVNFTKYGIAEKTQGAYTQTGAMTTMLPITVIFYMAAYYFIYQHKKSYIFTAISYILFSIVGAKRAVAFLYPLQFMFIYYFMYSKNAISGSMKKITIAISCLLFSALITGSIFYFNKSLNPENTTGGSIDTEYALNYALKYETNENVYGKTTGRLSTSVRIFSLIFESDIKNLFFGFGPGQGVKSEKYSIKYGTTSMTRVLLEFGLFGLIAYSAIFFVLAYMCYRYYTLKNDPYWKAFAAASVGLSLAMIFFYIAYNESGVWGDTMPALYFYAMGVVKVKLNRGNKGKFCYKNALPTDKLAVSTLKT